MQKVSAALLTKVNYYTQVRAHESGVILKVVDIIPPKDLALLVDALRANRSTLRVDLEGCGVQDAGCRVLGELLAANQRIEDLDLQMNQVSDVGAGFLAAALPRSGLRALRLADNSLSPVGAALLMDAGAEQRRRTGRCVQVYGLPAEVMAPLRAKQTAELQRAAQGARPPSPAPLADAASPAPLADAPSTPPAPAPLAGADRAPSADAPPASEVPAPLGSAARPGSVAPPGVDAPVPAPLTDAPPAPLEDAAAAPRDKAPAASAPGEGGGEAWRGWAFGALAIGAEEAGSAPRAAALLPAAAPLASARPAPLDEAPRADAEKTGKICLGTHAPSADAMPPAPRTDALPPAPLADAPAASEAG
ncbi:hypothetical protein T484DRAFT_1875311, partial [Baffinella frigidus]